MQKLTAIVTCFNEETNISDCLASLRFADEIVVVDSFSADRTLEITRQFTNRVLQHEFWSHGAQNNWAIPQAAHDWVFIVDADERVPPALAKEIRSLLGAPAYDGYWMRRTNFFLNKEIRHGTWGGDCVLRLFHRGRGRYQEKRVHSQVELNGNAGRCREALAHYSYRSLDDYMRKIHRFSTGGAQDMHDCGKHSSIWSMAIHSAGRFVKSYVIKRGFLDGTEGFIIACMEAYHAFLKYAKLWELQNAKDRKVSRTPTAAVPENRERTL